jgi:hypothetical protein
MAGSLIECGMAFLCEEFRGSGLHIKRFRVRYPRAGHTAVHVFVPAINVFVPGVRVARQGCRTHGFEPRDA